MTGTVEMETETTTTPTTKVDYDRYHPDYPCEQTRLQPRSDLWSQPSPLIIA